MSKVPERLPEALIIGNDKYDLVLLRVESRFEDGRPEVLRLIGMDQTCELSKNPQENCFHIAYLKLGKTEQYAGQIPTV